MKIESLFTKIYLLLAAVCLLTSCAATGPLFEPVPASVRKDNQVLIYIYRPDAFCAGGVSVTIYVNDQETVELKNNGYTFVLTESGRHEIHATLPFRTSGTTIRFDTLGGETYFVKWDNVCGPSSSRSTLGFVRNKQAQTEIATTRLQPTFTKEDLERRAQERKEAEEKREWDRAHGM